MAPPAAGLPNKHQQRCFGIEMSSQDQSSSPRAATFPPRGISNNASLLYSAVLHHPASTSSSSSLTRLLDTSGGGFLSTLIMSNGTSIVANGPEKAGGTYASGAAAAGAGVDVGITAGVDEAALRLGASQRDSLDQLRFYTYGVVMPTFCVLGILGNVLNLAVLTRPAMRSVSHIYMRGTSRRFYLGGWTVLPNIFSPKTLEIFVI
jgi:hypothetical protein